ncbi:MAG: nuclear transport factor 2 family protein [Chloroflexi bacterium]|nr:nuclear transport factor 2 family protein [Chloroflexota bacterium]
MVAPAWRIAGLAASLGLFLAAACFAGGGADAETAARLETVVREYLRAVSEADAELFCARIEPQLGFFSDEENCLEVQRYMKGGRGDFAPRIRGQLLSDITSQLVAIEGTEVSGDKAFVLAAIRWTGEGPDGFADLGEAELTVRLVRTGDAWRIASFENSASPPSQDTEVQAASRAVFDYFQALAKKQSTSLQTRFMLETPVSLGEYRSRRIVSAVIGVEFKEGYAAVTHDTHWVSNGAIGYPSRNRLVLERSTSGWRPATDTDLAYSLFEDP